MENAPIPQPENIELRGPDGYQFSVQNNPVNNTVDQFTQNSEILPQISLGTEGDIGQAVTLQPETHEQLGLVPEVPVRVGVLAAAGIGAALAVRRYRNNPSRFRGPGSRRQQTANRRESDRDSHRSGARAELDRHQTPETRLMDQINGVDDVYPKPIDANFSPQINLETRFANNHRRRRLENPINHDTFVPVQASDARTRRQELSGLRSNLRGDAARKRIGEIDKWRELYGPAVTGTREDLEDYIDQNHFSRKYIKRLRSAGRKVRGLQRSEARIDGRLVNQANSDDLPGRTSRANQRLHRD